MNHFAAAEAREVKLPAPIRKAIEAALSERDESGGEIGVRSLALPAPTPA
jgi:hypothetical protein